MRRSAKANTIYSYIIGGIESAKFRVGERIPTERELAEQFNVSRPPVMAAIHKLVKEGLIRRKGKAGSVVIGAPPRKSRVFGAVLLGLARQHQNDTIFSAVGNEIAHCAALEHSMVLIQDPSWEEFPGGSAMAGRYQAIADQFIASKVAGVFLMPLWILPDQALSSTAIMAERFDKASIPVVLIDGDITRYPARSHYDLVGIDNFGSGYVLAQHFLDLGCRKIDFFAAAMRHPTQEARIAGYLKALESRGILVDPSGIHYGDLNSDFVVQILRLRRPEAVLVVNDQMAASVMSLAIGAGIKVPEELRIGGFDDLPMSSRLAVPLTTIRQPAAGIGAVAFQIMLQRITAADLPPMHTELNGELIIRASSGFRPAGKMTARKRG